MMEMIVGPRGSGKTTELVRRALRSHNAKIYVVGPSHRLHVVEVVSGEIRKQGVDPLTALRRAEDMVVIASTLLDDGASLRGKASRSPTTRPEVFIDNVDIVWSNFFGSRVRGASVADGSFTMLHSRA